MTARDWNWIDTGLLCLLGMVLGAALGWWGIAIGGAYGFAHGAVWAKHRSALINETVDPILRMLREGR